MHTNTAIKSDRQVTVNHHNSVIGNTTSTVGEFSGNLMKPYCVNWHHYLVIYSVATNRQYSNNIFGLHKIGSVKIRKQYE